MSRPSSTRRPKRTPMIIVLARRGVPAALLGLAWLGLAACGTSAPTADSGAGRLIVYGGDTGVIIGQVWRRPATVPRSGSTDRPVPVPGDLIKVRDDAGEVVRIAVTDGGGFYDVVVSPGVYRITEARGGVSRTVEVSRSQIMRVSMSVGPGD